MTFRAKPVVKRAHRPSWDSRDRKNFYLNLGFGLVVLVAVVILAVAVAVTYYNDHLASVGSVDGQSITKDEFADRLEIESWRLREAENRVRTQKVAGHLTQAQADLQLQLIQQQVGSIQSIALERLIDSRIQAQLAVEEGVAVTDADIEARLTTEATTPESRRSWVIELEPELDADAAEPTAAQRAAAKAKAETALADLRAGKSWDDIAKTVSTDASTAPQAGDLGWLQAEDSQTDEAFLDALFAAEANKPTAVVEGEDGVFRIGRVTEVTPESVDGAYIQKLETSNIDLAKYREVVRGDVVHQKLEDKVVAEATKPGPQREVSEIYLSEATTQLADDAVKVRHILYSPNDDPAAANAGEIPDDDPAWAKAEADAQAAYQKLKTDPSQFDAIARAESDEESARGESGSGGDLPEYVAEGSGYVESFITPVLAANAKDGDILAPFKTEFGYHIVQIANHRPDLAAIKTQIDGGADFAALARDFSESETADRGGDLGWIAKAQLPSALIGPMFAAPIGKTSEIATVAGDGQYLYKSRAEEVRTPEGRQLEEIRSSAFNDWYDAKKAEIEVTRGSGDAGDTADPGASGG